MKWRKAPSCVISMWQLDSKDPRDFIALSRLVKQHSWQIKMESVITIYEHIDYCSCTRILRLLEFIDHCPFLWKRNPILDATWHFLENESHGKRY